MPLNIEKPAPLMIGDKAFYNLTSYDPVHVEVQVPRVTDFDVDMAVATALREAGGSPENLDDPAWLAEHFDGISDKGQLREVMRAQVTFVQGSLAEEQKTARCVAELTKRLRQSIPPTHLRRARDGARFALEQQLTVDGLMMDQFLAQSRMRPQDLEAMLDEQALTVCEQNAALDAYAREKKLTVSEDEFCELLGIPEDELATMVSQMKAAGQYEQLSDAALHAKAARMVVSECQCTYLHETPEEARRRVAQFQEFQRQLDNGGLPTNQSPKDPSAGSTGSNPAGLHLVP